jgi:hypothetical protein
MELMPAWQTLQRLHEDRLADPRWRTTFDRRGVRGSMLDLEDGTVPVVRCDTAIGASPDTLATFLVDDILETLPQWNPLSAGGELLESGAPGERVLRLVNRLPWPLRPREDVFRNVRKTLEDGTVVEISVGLAHPAAPLREDMVRSTMHLATKRMHPRADGGCDYIATWHYDLGGSIARWLPRTLLARTICADLAKECDRLRDRFGAVTDVHPDRE